MTTNPFASPADAAEPPTGNPLKPVAITLLAMSVLWMFVCAFVIANFLFAAANAKDPGMVRFYQYRDSADLPGLPGGADLRRPQHAA
jgi:hypothetical protein